jgi:VanZ family protein
MNGLKRDSVRRDGRNKTSVQYLSSFADRRVNVKIMLMKARMTFIRNFKKYWLPLICWIGLTLWMSTGTFSFGNTSFWVERILLFLFPGIPPEQAKLINVFLRRAGHVTEYFILGILLFRAFRGGSAASWKWRWFWGALIVVVLWAAIDEFHQSLVPTRTPSSMDVGIDAAGGILALFVIALFHRHRKK